MIDVFKNNQFISVSLNNVTYDFVKQSFAFYNEIKSFKYCRIKFAKQLEILNKLLTSNETTLYKLWHGEYQN